MERRYILAIIILLWLARMPFILKSGKIKTLPERGGEPSLSELRSYYTDKGLNQLMFGLSALYCAELIFQTNATSFGWGSKILFLIIFLLGVVDLVTGIKHICIVAISYYEEWRDKTQN